MTNWSNYSVKAVRAFETTVLFEFLWLDCTVPGKPPQAKLAKRMAKDGRVPMLVACGVYRPAAIDQLEVLAKQERLCLLP